jgi:hypothetical protein
LRRIPLSRRSHVIGFQPLASGTAEHESALERDFVTLASFLDPNAHILAQPVTISFRDGLKSRRYTPDFLVRYSNLTKAFIEVKYRCDLLANRERLEPAFTAMRAWAVARDATFDVVTDDRIRGPTLENAKHLLPLRVAPLDAALAEVTLKTVSRLEAPTISDTISTVPMRRPAALAVLWQLIARGLLRVDVSAPITPDTPVLLP